MSLLAVAEARQLILDGRSALPAEIVPLSDAHLRVNADALAAQRTQPPFSSSAMDGYAVRHADLALNTSLTVVGEAPAGHGFSDRLLAHQAVRIFTGAPLPVGADTILIQEHADLAENAEIRPLEIPQPGAYVRAAGLDFQQGDMLIPAPKLLRSADLALLASMNHAYVSVIRKPRVAVLATGDELAMPGSDIGPDQIVASNNFGIVARIAELGGCPVDLGIARDTEAELLDGLKRARTERCDAIITLGGASVGTHDLVQQAFQKAGLQLAFWKIAMRPGKPLMSGSLDDMVFLGFPGNPVSSMVCAELFLAPLIKQWLGLSTTMPFRPARLLEPLPANDRREDYLRAVLKEEDNSDGYSMVRPLGRQDSSMLANFARADCLIKRPPFAPAADAGALVDILSLRS